MLTTEEVVFTDGAFCAFTKPNENGMIALFRIEVSRVLSACPDPVTAYRTALSRCLLNARPTEENPSYIQSKEQETYQR
jgi:DNA-binding IclR family transcriptional regulator